MGGTVSDATGGVLPGATVMALHEASGNTFLAVTDERGAFRIPARTVDTRGAKGNFQLNLDGQQVTQIHAYGQGQPQLSRDSIAEFQFIANRFDATQGRSAGVQVNAITKSGTNTPSGSFSGYFRQDSLNAPDFVARRVLPYSNRQLSATFGGPIRRDKLHLFGHLL